MAQIPASEVEVRLGYNPHRATATEVIHAAAGFKDKGIPGLPKVRMELIPPEAMLEVGRVYTGGADRVGARNWEQGIPYGDCYAAAQRHLHKFWAGEGTDPQHGTHHLAHAIFWLLALLQFEQQAERYKAFDNRPKGEK